MQLTAAFTSDGCAVVGGATGSLHKLQLATGKLVATAANAHGGAIHVVCEGPGGALLSCGKDGEVRMWSAALEPVRSHALLAAVAQALPLLTPRADGRPPRLRALDWDDPTGALLVGTAGSELLVVDTNAPAKSRLLGTGHAPPKRGTMGAVAGGGGGGAVEEADEELGAARAGDGGVARRGGDGRRRRRAPAVERLAAARC